MVACAPGIMEATGLRSPAYNEDLAYARGCKVEDLSTDYSKVIPMGRDGKLDEVGDLVAYLVSQRIVRHWHARCQNWDMVLCQLQIMFADRAVG